MPEHDGSGEIPVRYDMEPTGDRDLPPFVGIAGQQQLPTDAPLPAFLTDEKVADELRRQANALRQASYDNGVRARRLDEIADSLMPSTASAADG